MVQLRTESGWKKMGRLVIDGNSVYEIDEECEACLCRESLHAETDKRIGKMEKRETEEADS